MRISSLEMGVNMGEFTEVLKDLIDNDEFPRGVKTSLEKYMDTIDPNAENEMKSLVIDVLEQASNDPNIHPSSRTQLWTAISLIEDLDRK
ncbi:MAG: UPF0147 family protein [Candidatus Aenigmarchaeota archaeon]|nr:UPF0147 family protein [Candidatus Aenigmarchaeota archaeon]